MSRRLGDASLPLEAIIVKSREFDPTTQPNLTEVKTCVLKDGPKAYKIATHWTIRNAKTGDAHHHVLILETIRKTSKGWIRDSKHTITLDDQEDNEIQRLFDFFSSMPGVTGSGNYIVINPGDVDKSRFNEILNAVSGSERKLELIAQILSWADTDPAVTSGLIELASDKPVQAKSLAAALNYGRLLRALDEFRGIVDQDLQERFYQTFLKENYWMFGSEYSELLDKRNLVAGMELDFPLRRTVDGFLDIIEIKRPMNGAPLFREDPSHSTFYPSTELAKAVAQTRGYLRKLTANQYTITALHELRVEKVRAKLVIGRDGDERQLEELQALNADTSGVEIITFDQLTHLTRFECRGAVN